MPEEVAGMVQEVALQLKELNKRLDSVITHHHLAAVTVNSAELQ